MKERDPFNITHGNYVVSKMKTLEINIDKYSNLFVGVHIFKTPKYDRMCCF